MAQSLNQTPDDLPQSEFLAGRYVTYKRADGYRVCGQIVGPDQTYFPSPLSVFVSFPSTGFTHLLDIELLELADAEGSAL